MNYPSHWRMAFLLAIFFHLGVWLAGALILPHLHAASLPAPTAEQALDWEQIDEDDGEAQGPDDNKEPQPAETAQQEPEQMVEEAPTEEEQEQTPIIADADDPATVDLLKQDKEDPNKINGIVTYHKHGENGKSVTMGNPPVTLSKFYPSNLTSFHGPVGVSVTIGTLGKVTAAKIMVTSGNPGVDSLAMDAAKRWTFKPATDQDGQPMECYKNIRINF